jgi:hypothetical protein
MGHERHFDRSPVTSGLPLRTDIGGTGRHVSKVPEAEAGPARLTPLHERELRAAFAINYLGNPGQDDRPVAPAPQL